MVDLSRAKRTPYAHQIVGVERLIQTVEPEIGRIYPGCFFLADEMRLGKTKQILDAVQALYEMKEVRVVIVVTPATIRDVWFDPELGEIKKHRWDGLPTLVTEYHSTIRKWSADTDGAERFLTFIVTNYEYIRYAVKRGNSGWSGPHLHPLLKFCTDSTVLVLDESSAIANADTLQTRACAVLRRKCGKVFLLNGTPIVESPRDLFSQAKMLDPRIFGVDYVSQFLARYAIMGGYEVRKAVWDAKLRRRVIKDIATEILGWRHQPKPGCCDVPLHINSPVHGPGPGLEEIQARLAPYVLRRIRSECLDLPPKLEPVTLTATLTAETWRIYCEMRDQLVAWLDKQTVAVSAQAGIKVMRLAQITSGFLGGLRDEETICPECGGAGYLIGNDLTPAATLTPPASFGKNLGVNLELKDTPCPACGGTGGISAASPLKVISSEKLSLFLNWVGKRLVEEPNFRMVVWCRFQKELFRILEEVPKLYPGVKTLGIYGGQKKPERVEGLRLMHPDVHYEGPAILVGTVQTGSVGLNMAGAHEVVYFSNPPSLYHRQQSEDRPHGPGQTSPISYHDIVAVGPKGQHTIEHHVLKALRNKKELANWTCAAWMEALKLE